MKQLEEELNEIIKKNLPQQVGETLKARLDQAERDAADNTTKNKEK